MARTPPRTTLKTGKRRPQKLVGSASGVYATPVRNNFVISYAPVRNPTPNKYLPRFEIQSENKRTSTALRAFNGWFFWRNWLNATVPPRRANGSTDEGARSLRSATRASALSCMACAAQYNARVFELRRLGFNVENRTECVDGVRHSWFRLVNSPAAPAPEPAKIDGLQLFDHLGVGS